jgi:hypothetical protein
MGFPRADRLPPPSRRRRRVTVASTASRHHGCRAGPISLIGYDPHGGNSLLRCAGIPQFACQPGLGIRAGDVDRFGTPVPAAHCRLAHQRAGLGRGSRLRRPRHEAQRQSRRRAGGRLRRLRRRIPGSRRHHEGGHEYPRSEHGGDAVEFRCGGRFLRGRSACGGDAAHGLYSRRQHLSSTVGQLHLRSTNRQAKPATRSRLPATRTKHRKRASFWSSAETSNYPVGDVEETARPDDSVQIVARLVSTAVDPEEMDAIVNALTQSAVILDAAWTSSTTD